MKGAVGRAAGADQFRSTDFFQFWSQVLNHSLLSQEGAVSSKQACSISGDCLSEAQTIIVTAHSKVQPAPSEDWLLSRKTMLDWYEQCNKCLSVCLKTRKNNLYLNILPHFWISNSFGCISTTEQEKF